MLFTSYPFIFAYLPIVVVVTALLRRRSPRAAVAWIVAASAFFYGWFNVYHLLLLVSLMIANYLVARAIEATNGAARRGILGLGIAGNVAVLCWFKYSAFLVETVDPSLAQAWHLRDIALPLAISFFIFQKIAFLADVAKGLARPNDFLDYSLFVLFFPQLIAGPIVHYRDIVPQIPAMSGERRLSADLAHGLSLFTLGLAKKILLADQLGGFADPMFKAAASGAVPDTPAAWIGVLAFTFQLYFDFSAYSDMAIGLARCLGIELPVNFNSPYKARDPIEFWRRWHITLSLWLRDYLFIPLGGNRRGEFRRYVNIAITMLLGGLWHGAAWTFLLWGGMHAVLIISTHLARHVFGVARRPVAVALSSSATFAAVTLCWVPFRASGMDAAARVYRGLFSGNAAIPDGAPLAIATITVAALICWLMPNAMEIFGRVPSGRTWLRWRPSRVWATGLALLFLASLLYVPASAKFIYFQF